MRAGQRRVLVVVVHRVRSGLLDLLLQLRLDRVPRWTEQERCAKVTVIGLAVLFDEEITPEFLDGFFDKTEGNAFFIEEVCKALAESGELRYEDGRWHRPDMNELGIPHSVRVAIQSRIRVLPRECQETLQLAAVLGREFDLDILADASPLNQDILIESFHLCLRSIYMKSNPISSEISSAILLMTE